MKKYWHFFEKYLTFLKFYRVRVYIAQNSWKKLKTQAKSQKTQAKVKKNPSKIGNSG